MKKRPINMFIVLYYCAFVTFMWLSELLFIFFFIFRRFVTVITINFKHWWLICMIGSYVAITLSLVYQLDSDTSKYILLVQYTCRIIKQL